MVFTRYHTSHYVRKHGDDISQVIPYSANPVQPAALEQSVPAVREVIVTLLLHFFIKNDVFVLCHGIFSVFGCVWHVLAFLFFYSLFFQVFFFLPRSDDIWHVFRSFFFGHCLFLPFVFLKCLFHPFQILFRYQIQSPAHFFIYGLDMRVLMWEYIPAFISQLLQQVCFCPEDTFAYRIFCIFDDVFFLCLLFEYHICSYIDSSHRSYPAPRTHTSCCHCVKTETYQIPCRFFNLTWCV